MEGIVAVGVLNLPSFLLHGVIVVVVVFGRRIGQVIETRCVFTD
jgi:hypothetical protein